MRMKRYAFFNSEKLYINFKKKKKKIYILTFAIFLSQEIPPSTESFLYRGHIIKISNLYKLYHE